jgi:hypothetical protein
MLRLTTAIQAMLEEDYGQIAKHCDLEVMDPDIKMTTGQTIRTMDKRIFVAGENSQSVYTAMKLEVEMLEICSNCNRQWTMENKDLASWPYDYKKLFENYQTKHAEDDFRMRWQGMVHEMTAPRNCTFAIKRFGNAFPGPLELFFTYRMRGLIYTYCERQDGDEFTFPEVWGKSPDIGESKMIKLLWIYKDERDKAA